MLTDCDFYSKQSITELQAQLAHKQKKIQILKQEKNSMLNRIDELNQKVHDQAEEFKKYRLKFRGLEKQHSHLKNQNENLKKDQSMNNETITLFQKGFKRDEFKKHERTVAQLQNDIIKLSNALEEHKIVRESNCEEITRQLIYIQELESQLNTYKSLNEDDQLKYNNQQLYQTIEDLNYQLQSSIQQKDEDNQHQLQELQQLADIAKLENKELTLKIAQQEKLYQMQIQKIIKLCESVYDELSNKISNKQEVNDILQKLVMSKKDFDLDLLKIESEINSQTCEELQNKVENLSSENQNIKQKFQATSTNKEALQMREKDLVHQIDKLQQQVERQKELNQMRQKTMSEQISALQRTNKQLNQDLDKITKEVQDLREEKVILQQTIQRQEKKIQTLSLSKYK
ncbi:unnamed protein product (macronuclear) [Paramecium tetraurelia]|uniref:Uncharacterized protein n=1 Tax=Paramecium tetraurelia TaxID=5888 RepID=A0EEX7_PARTE|nr:uncharacterized protein GSPATT00026191001 [Paramecium tetraurelia]CAK93868.1 unnamed protein product [Paramecium tetraurelia]|eukprot:XP_001461241.1 hypothetical protein (macronuclear) [Paramecium tetraurelia strain d4-2]